MGGGEKTFCNFTALSLEGVWQEKWGKRRFKNYLCTIYMLAYILFLVKGINKKPDIHQVKILKNYI
jgi:hypothetical protein